MKTRSNIVFLVLLMVFASVLLGFFWSRYLHPGDNIIDGIYIGNAYVGGKTREEAKSILSAFDPDELIQSPLSFIFEDEKNIVMYEFKPSLIGAFPMAEESVDDAVRLSQKEGYLKRAYYRIRKVRRIIPPRFTVKDDDLLKNVIIGLSEQINCESENARFVIVSPRSKNGTNHRVVIREDKKECKVLVEDTANETKELLEAGKSELPVIVKFAQAKITSNMLRRVPSPEIIGSYTTYYGSHDSPNRISNIYLVSSFVDNTYLNSGEVFSLLSHIGDFSEEKGFKEAYVIMGDELVPQYGGGTCQIATTLYNSVMMADLDVIKRVNHGIYFSIYPLGRDATVYPPSPDFKFRNNTGHPIVIYAMPFKKGLTFRIIGHPTGKKATFSSPEIKHKYITITTTEADSDIPVKRKIKLSHFSAKVIRTVRLNGEVIETEEIKSSYKLHGDKQKVKIRRKEPR